MQKQYNWFPQLFPTNPDIQIHFNVLAEGNRNRNILLKTSRESHVSNLMDDPSHSG